MDTNSNTQTGRTNTTKKRHKAPTHQEDYLEDKVEMYKLKGQTKRSNIIHNILNTEDMRKKFQLIAYTLKASPLTDLTQVQYPTKNKLWETSTTPEDLETRILNQQDKHFTQANQTPIATHYKGRVHDSTELYKNFAHNNLPDTNLGIKQFFRRENNTEIKTEITSEDFRMGMKNGRNEQAHPHWADTLDTTMSRSCPEWKEKQKDGQTCFFGYTAL